MKPCFWCDANSPSSAGVNVSLKMSSLEMKERKKWSGKRSWSFRHQSFFSSSVSSSDCVSFSSVEEEEGRTSCSLSSVLSLGAFLHKTPGSPAEASGIYPGIPDPDRSGAVNTGHNIQVTVYRKSKVTISACYSSKIKSQNQNPSFSADISTFVYYENKTSSTSKNEHLLIQLQALFQTHIRQISL